jgi:hypothetical protein
MATLCYEATDAVAILQHVLLMYVQRICNATEIACNDDIQVSRCKATIGADMVLEAPWLLR